MYIHKLYPPHMWYKHLASILAASGSLTKLAFLQNLRLRECSPKQNWRHHPWSKGPGPATYKIKHNVVRGRPWGPCSSRASALVAVASESHRCCPCFLGKTPPMVLCKKPKSKEPTKVEPQNQSANDCNDWRDIFACNGLLPKGAGMVFAVFSGTLKSTRNPRRIETHLGTRVQSDGSTFSGVRDHESLRGSTGVILAASHEPSGKKSTHC